jgi:hypothetical protein
MAFGIVPSRPQTRSRNESTSWFHLRWRRLAPRQRLRHFFGFHKTIKHLSGALRGSATSMRSHLCFRCCLRRQLSRGRGSRDGSRSGESFSVPSGKSMPTGRIRSLHRVLHLFKRSLETHFLYAGDQSRSLHPQKLRGTINAFDLPAGLLQNSKKVLPLAASHF